MAETAAQPQRAGMPFTFEDFVNALRMIVEPDPVPPPHLVTIRETSDPELDKKLFCSNCLDGKDGSPWSPHVVYWWAADEARPGRLKRVEHLHAHPSARKVISYDERAAKAGLEKGTHGKQCLQCGERIQAPIGAGPR